MTMRRFLKKIIIATVLFSSLIVGVYFLLHLMFQKPIRYNNNCVFVWGDSQMYYGFDVNLFGDKTSKQVLTSAHRGSGIYDFLVSEKNIPNNFVCIVSFPECALLRKPSSDYNRTGYELSCLQMLFLAGCPKQECLRIEKLNRRNMVYQAFGNNHHLIAYADSLVCEREPISFWHSFFEERNEWFKWKAQSYKEGIQNLSNKQSQIILIQFPFNEQIESFVQSSINRHLTDSLKFELIDKYTMKHDTIILYSDSLLMHDLSHLNEVGARMITVEIADILANDTHNNHFIEVRIQHK